MAGVSLDRVNMAASEKGRGFDGHGPTAGANVPESCSLVETEHRQTDRTNLGFGDEARLVGKGALGEAEGPRGRWSIPAHDHDVQWGRVHVYQAAQSTR